MLDLQQSQTTLSHRAPALLHEVHQNLDDLSAADGLDILQPGPHELPQVLLLIHQVIPHSLHRQVLVGVRRVDQHAVKQQPQAVDILWIELRSVHRFGRHLAPPLATSHLRGQPLQPGLGAFPVHPRRDRPRGCGSGGRGSGGRRRLRGRQRAPVLLFVPRSWAPALPGVRSGCPRPGVVCTGPRCRITLVPASAQLPSAPSSTNLRLEPGIQLLIQQDLRWVQNAGTQRALASGFRQVQQAVDQPLHDVQNLGDVQRLSGLENVK
mmetsp:Transcript_6333/g.15165  ORF Transcript_6333/g.15165 Transcript_6333/m.15165 type:complete len:266 (-) Transcript_6333:924-1721(-)